MTATTNNKPQPASVAVQHPDLGINFSISDMPDGTNVSISLQGVELSEEQKFAIEQMLGVWKYGLVESEE